MDTRPLLSLTIAAVALFCLTVLPVHRLEAQGIGPLLERIHTSIMQVIDDPKSTVDVAVTGKGQVFAVSRVNSTLNLAGHSAREREALRIALTATKEFERTAASRDIRSIRILYVSRMEGSRDKVIDRLEFRRDSDRIFELHMT